MMVSAYNEFKIMQGFDANEIFDKSTSLKGIFRAFFEGWKSWFTKTSRIQRY